MSNMKKLQKPILRRRYETQQMGASKNSSSNNNYSNLSKQKHKSIEEGKFKSLIVAKGVAENLEPVGVAIHNVYPKRSIVS